MAKVFISEFVQAAHMNTGQPFPSMLQPPTTSQVVAIGGSSTQSTAFDARTRFVRVHADAICSFAIGSNPTADANSARMAAGQTEYFQVKPGHKIAVITNT